MGRSARSQSWVFCALWLCAGAGVFLHQYRAKWCSCSKRPCVIMGRTAGHGGKRLHDGVSNHLGHDMRANVVGHGAFAMFRDRIWSWPVPKMGRRAFSA